MSLPIFFQEDLSAERFTLNEETSKHVVRVLRMKKGQQLQLTDGKGTIAIVEIIAENKRASEAKVLSTSNIPLRTSNISIGISLIKNSNRFEWFLEKATEIGVSEIIPIICERTEKQHFRTERMRSILISAMLQSQQSWLPILHEPKNFRDIINLPYRKKYMAHSAGNEKINLSSMVNRDKTEETSEVLPMGEDLGGAIILIGPEGDFTEKEIDTAKQNDFKIVSLGNTRLRTETAGIVAGVLLNQLIS